MKQDKITLPQLENFLFKSADILRGKMGPLVDVNRHFELSDAGSKSKMIT